MKNLELVMDAADVVYLSIWSSENNLKNFVQNGGLEASSSLLDYIIPKLFEDDSTNIPKGTTTKIVC